MVTSLKIGLLATGLATLLGTLMAFAMVRHHFRGRSTANVLIFLPMASPEIVLGSSLLALFVNAGFAGQLGFWTIFIAHVMFCLSFVVITVKARLAGLDPRLEQAAEDLYANEWQTFWRVTFPLVLPGIVSAALLSFSLSFDDFIITNLNSGQTVTFPMYVWGAAQRGIPMQINVIGTLMFLRGPGAGGRQQCRCGRVRERPACGPESIAPSTRAEPDLSSSHPSHVLLGLRADRGLDVAAGLGALRACPRPRRGPCGGSAPSRRSATGRRSTAARAG